MDDRSSMPGSGRNFSIFHRAQTRSGSLAASYPMGTGGSSLSVKRPEREADHSPPTSARLRMSEVIPFRAMVLN